MAMAGVHDHRAEATTHMQHGWIGTEGLACPGMPGSERASSTKNRYEINVAHV